MLGLAELLKLRGLDLLKGIKIVRHQDKRYNVQEMLEKGLLEVYQSYQANAIFDCDYVISTIGAESTKALFHNVYKVIEKKKAKEVQLDGEYIFKELVSEIVNKDGWYYLLEKVDGFEDLSDRVVIEWGKATIQWNQHFSREKDKEVIEILPEGYVKEFPGFDKIILSFRELERIINKPDANREWKRMLASVAGVYLILDTETGNQYIGSAYGKDGIWGRWSNYIPNGTGGNKMLQDLVNENESNKYNFQYSVLKTMAISSIQKEVVDFERLYKNKLGSRAFGLNLN